MDPGRRRLLVLFLIAAPAVAGGIFFLTFPKAETPRMEDLPVGPLQLVGQANVTGGDDGRPATGHVSVYWNGTGHILRFEGYDADPGPNVWFHLVRSADARTERSVEDEGLRLRVPGPGHATYRGDFNVPIPIGTPMEEFQGVVAWDRTLDERFAVALFGPLAPAQTP